MRLAPEINSSATVRDRANSQFLTRGRDDVFAMGEVGIPLDVRDIPSASLRDGTILAV